MVICNTIFFSMMCNHFVSLDTEHIFIDTVLLNTYEPKHSTN